MKVWRFCLDDIRDLLHTTWKVTIPPFSTVSIHANSSGKGHCMQVHVLIEPMPGPQLLAAVVPMPTYEELHPGSSRVPICLHNLNTYTTEIPTKAVVGQVVPANQVPLVGHLTRTTKESKQKPPKGWVLDALDLQGLKEWPESEQRQARELLLKWEHLFVHSNLDLGKNCSDQAQNTTNRLNAFQRALLAYTASYVQSCEGPYPGNAGYWCYP